MRGRPWAHRIDRWAGIPLVFALGRLRRKRARVPQAIERLGLLQINAIGDTVLSLAVLQDLRRALPQAELWFVHGQSNREAAALAPAEVRRLELPVARPLQALRTLRTLSFDVLIDCGPWPRLNALLAGSARARFKIGYRTLGQHRHFAYDRAVEHAACRHELENLRALLEPLGIEGRAVPRLEEAAHAELPALPARFVVFHPWPGGVFSELKAWPETRWVALAEWLAARGYAIVLSGGPADRAPSERLLVRMREALGERAELVSLAGRVRLAAMTRVLVRARALVTVNTGIMHLGAALDVPLVALHGPTRVERWGPLGSRSIALRSRYSGCGYLHLGFEYAGRRGDCMAGIEVEDVERALERLGLGVHAAPRP